MDRKSINIILMSNNKLFDSPSWLVYDICHKNLALH